MNDFFIYPFLKGCFFLFFFFESNVLRASGLVPLSGGASFKNEKKEALKLNKRAHHPILSVPLITDYDQKNAARSFELIKEEGWSMEIHKLHARASCALILGKKKQRLTDFLKSFSAHVFFYAGVSSESELLLKTDIPFLKLDSYGKIMLQEAFFLRWMENQPERIKSFDIQVKPMRKQQLFLAFFQRTIKENQFFVYLSLLLTFLTFFFRYVFSLSVYKKK